MYISPNRRGRGCSESRCRPESRPPDRRPDRAPSWRRPRFPSTETSPTLAAVGPGIDGHAGDRLLAAGRIVRPVAARVSGPVVERLRSLVLERRQVAGSFRHTRGDDPIGKRERRGIVVDRDSLGKGVFLSRQERRKCDSAEDCGSQSHASGRTFGPGHVRPFWFWTDPVSSCRLTRSATRRTRLSSCGVFLHQS